MQRCTLLAPAKINLYLEIIGDRPDGFHELAMVLQSVGLADRLILTPSLEPGIRLHCSHPLVPTDSTNLAYRAADLMARSFPSAARSRLGSGLNMGLDIVIEKNIPVGAGLAGGSTDGAAVLVGLDLLWDLGLTQAELQTLGAELGSDVPFCVSGGTALATGRGEQLSTLPALGHLWVVLAKYRSLSVSTPWAYGRYRELYESGYVREAGSLAARRERVHSGPMVAAIVHQDGPAISQLMVNDLEKVVLPQHPPVAALRGAMAAQPGCIGAMMSGSGPTVFGLCESRVAGEAIAAAIRQQLPDPDLDLWVTPFGTQGIHLEV
jgi:4-diphosphocytidyl-2-C-methyl-D-erythritol kinase